MALALALSGGDVHAANGFAKKLTGKEKISVSGCGRDTANLKISNLKIRSDRTWKAKIDGKTLEGTYTQNNGGRNLKLKMNSRTKRRVLNALANWAAEVCENDVTGEKLTKVDFKVKLNKKRNRAKGTVLIKAKGRSSEGPGKATYTAQISGNYKHR